MTAQERKQVTFVFSAAVVVVSLLGGRMLIDPLAEADATLARLSGKIETLDLENKKRDHYESRTRALAAHTFGTDERKVREKVRARLMLLAKQSGLNTREKWDLSPVTGGRKRNVYREIGWSIRTQGRLEHVVNFLYLLRADPHLHQLTGLSLSPVLKSRDVRLTVKYMTLALRGKGLGISETQPSKPLKSPTLDDKRLAHYQAIVTRDFFRPYVKRRIVHRPPPRRREEPGNPPQRDPKPSGPPLETLLRVVSLSQLTDRPEVCIYNTRSDEIKYFSPGDKFAGGTIVAVDYRKMPRLDNPEILSESRVIVKIGSAYWAIELGQVLADKHRLRPSQLPAELIEHPSTAPATKIVSTTVDNV